MPAMHPLLVGLVDPRAPSRPRYNEELKQALRNVTSVLRYEEVPDKEWFLLHSAHTLNHWCSREVCSLCTTLFAAPIF
jgi:hypothetical protein